jgi:hypothetical protein
MSKYLENIIIAAACWVAGFGLVGFGYWVIGHQSSSAFEIALFCFASGCYLIWLPLSYLFKHLKIK